MDQITIVCRITAKPSHCHEVRNILTDLAKQTRTEPGNINYILHVSDDDPCLFIIYENWRDQKALDCHMDQDYLKSFLDRQEELLEAPVDGAICRQIG